MNFSVQRRGHPRSVDPSQPLRDKLTLGAGRVQVLRIDYLRFTIDYVKWWSGFAELWRARECPQSVIWGLNMRIRRRLRGKLPWG